MGTITLRQAAEWCGGYVDPKYADVTFLGAGNDSRSILPGQLFVALEGVRDGHAFIAAAMKKGAAAVLCRRCDGDYPTIVVQDTRLALGQIAARERQRIGMKVVGVTGSVGKSTTKEMIAAVLDGDYIVSKTPANHNNDIGMPMAILAMPENTQVAVLEMGMNHFGEIAYLTGIARPDVAVIINIGTMHIEHLGSREGILQAKLEILEGMDADGRVFLNGDDSLLWGCRRKIQKPVTYFGVENPACGVRGSDIQEGGGTLRYQVTCGESGFPVTLPLEGIHYAADSLAAVSVGLAMGVAPERIRDRLGRFQNLEGRQQVFQAKGCTVIQDCYNAGPESMAAALSVLGKYPGRRVAVLGDMLELGARTQAEHYLVGRIAAENADLVLAYGPNSRRVVGGAITGGIPESRAKAFEDRGEMAEALRRMCRSGDVLLFKGSHGMHMELVLERFLKEET